MSARHEKEKGGVNVQVLLRCRPFSDDELRNNAPQVVTCNDCMREVAVSQSIAGKHIDRVFTFDKVLEAFLAPGLELWMFNEVPKGCFENLILYYYTICSLPHSDNVGVIVNPKGEMKAIFYVPVL